MGLNERSERLVEVRHAYGWSQRQVGSATHYSKESICKYERGVHPVPDDLWSWLSAIEPPHNRTGYPPTPGGLRMLIRRRRMRVVEVAAFCGVAASTVLRWVRGGQIPMQVKAWLRAGAPATWEWGAPGAVMSRARPESRTQDRPAIVKEFVSHRKRVPTLVRQMEAAAKPRPWRRSRI